MTEYFIEGTFRCHKLNATLYPEACAALYRKWNAPNRVPQSGLINTDCTSCATGCAHDKQHPTNTLFPLTYRLSNGRTIPLKSYDKQVCPCGKTFQPTTRVQRYCAVDCASRKQKMRHTLAEGRT